MRRLESYVRKYGPELGPKFYHALQSQAAHAGVSARLRRKIDVLRGQASASREARAGEGGGEGECLPLFPDPAPGRDGPAVAVGA